MKDTIRKFTTIFLIFCCTLLFPSAQAEIINVPDDIETIQEAINESEDGDTVLVQPGTYVENINFSGKDIVVGSLLLITQDEAYIDSTIIDGNRNGRSVVAFRSGESEDALLTGFTLRNGYTDYGGGIYISDIYNRETNPTITHLKIRDNRVSDNGGGIHITRGAAPVIDNVIIEHNEARDGGGLAVFWEAHPTISNTLIVDNIGREEGGGTKFAYDADVIMRNIQVINNWAPLSAGIFCEEGASLTFENGVISGNYNEDSGGIALRGSNSSVNLSNILIYGNSSGDECYTIRLELCEVDFENLTIVGNPDNISDGIYASNSEFSIVNCIIRDHESFEVRSIGGSVIISYSDIENGENGVNCRYLEWGDGNIDEDPLFANAEEGDYHLTEDSPCIDAGDPESPIDPDSTRADMGAFHYPQGVLMFGHVSDDANACPIENALVSTTFGDTVFSDENGNWSIGPSMIGNFNITVHKPGYLDSTLTEMLLEHFDTLEINIALLHPEFRLSRDEVIVELNPGDSARFELEIENNGNGRLEYSSSKQMPGFEPWRLINRIELGEEDDYRYYGVILIDGLYFYLSVHTPDGNKIFVIYEDGELLDQFFQPGDSRFGIRDLAWDGELIWGTDGETVYGFDLGGDVDRSWDIQGDRYSSSITWDHKDEILWMARISGRSVTGYDRDGNIVSSLNWNEYRIYGLAYHGYDPDGFGLYVQSINMENDNQEIHKINTIDNDIMFVKTLYSDDDGRFEGGFISDSYFPNATAFFGINNTPDLDYLDIWFMDAYSGWMDLDPMAGVIEAGQTQDFELMIRTAKITLGELNGNLIFTHNAIGEADTLSIHLQNLNSVSKESTLAPDIFGITGTYPNPFNSTTTISYSIPSPATVMLGVYDLAGRRVSKLIDGYMQAGIHNVTLNAGDLPSGIYIVHLETVDKSQVRKIALIR
ncbi:T9SS type A sorting domain-containing protein [bacterium]|nr:T9SS type A sorting domain-containing protein [bacterium]